MYKKLCRTLVSLGFLFVFLVLGFTGAFGQITHIQCVETLKIAPETKVLDLPSSFCVSEGGTFLIPDAGKIKVFEKNGNLLKCLKEFEGGNGAFVEPRYCFYSKDGSKVGVLDYGVRKGFIFNRDGVVDFKPIKTFDCKKFGYDIKFAGDGIQTIVSGYITSKEGSPFDLYSINIETGQIDYLLPSHEKYGMKTNEGYVEEYFKKQTLPAIGIKGFFDIQGDDLFYVWEGALRIIKLDLRSKEITRSFGKETSYYNKPEGFRLSEPYIKGEFQATWKLQETFSYVRNIFATSNNVFVVYETGKKNESDVSTFRMQIYTINGNFIKDILIPNNPGRQMSFDKASNELYAITKSTGNGDLAILKYKITR
jgi:hypothetical protein